MNLTPYLSTIVQIHTFLITVCPTSPMWHITNVAHHQCGTSPVWHITNVAHHQCGTSPMWHMLTYSQFSRTYTRPYALWLGYDMHMVLIRVRYGVWLPSDTCDKPYRISSRRVQYGLSEGHLSPYPTRYPFLAQNTLKFKFHEKAKLIWKITNTRWEPQSTIWRQIRTVLSI